MNPETRMFARSSRILLALWLAVAGCQDGISPLSRQDLGGPQFDVSGGSQRERILRQSPTAPPLGTYQVSLWASQDREVDVAVDYQPVAGDSVGKPFLRFSIPKYGLIAGAGGVALAYSDSVLITLTIDTVRFSVDFQPSGAAFSTLFPARMAVSYANANPDLNGNGVLDGNDRNLEEQLAIWRRQASLDAWVRLWSKNDPMIKYVAAEVDHFSQYAVSW